MPISYTSLATAFISLAAVIGLVLLAGRMARATGLVKSRQGQRLALLETLQVDRTRSLRIVSCDGREVLMLVGGGSDVVLGWLPTSETTR